MIVHHWLTATRVMFSVSDKDLSRLARTVDEHAAMCPLGDDYDYWTESVNEVADALASLWRQAWDWADRQLAAEDRATSTRWLIRAPQLLVMAGRSAGNPAPGSPSRPFQHRRSP